jgi:S-DNA-T family DNA segregation ATPase FtsK/SpoIIIE
MLNNKIEMILSGFDIKCKVDFINTNSLCGLKFLEKYNLSKVLPIFNFIEEYLKIKIKPCNIKNYDFGFYIYDIKDEKIVNFNDKQFEFIFNKSLCNRNDIFFGVTKDKLSFPIIENIKDLPHILIAGTTGSGKSVSLNSIICSILKSCDHIKPNFVMIDTKIVELSMYKNLPNCQIATNVEDALELLEDVDIEIDARYRVMERNNEKIIPDYMSRKIVIIEELADLMLTSKKVVEKYIVRIAQLGRACGVHLIVATQRPTVNVITGLIKANIGCRLALRTTSSIDSRVILDEIGAEDLNGAGDCLLKLPNKNNVLHIQCPYISDDDIKNVIDDFIKKGGGKYE